MSNADAERWDKKYRGSDPIGAADPWLTDNAHFLFESNLTSDAETLIPIGHGRALDLACGLGQNALFLAEKGFDTTAVDISQRALTRLRDESARRNLSIDVQCADLDDWRQPQNHAWVAGPGYDVICVFRFLNRSLFAPIVAALAPGGILYYQTFNQNHLLERPGFNPQFVLAPGELARGFAPLRIIECIEPPHSSQPSSYLIAEKPQPGG